MNYLVLVLLLSATITHADEVYQRKNAVGFWTGLGQKIVRIHSDLSVSICIAARDGATGESFLICEGQSRADSSTGYVYRSGKDRLDYLSGDETVCSNLIMAASGLAFYIQVSSTDVDQLRYRHIRDNRTLRRWQPPAGYRILEAERVR